MRIKVKIPTSLNEVTLEQYQKYLAIQETSKDEFTLGTQMIQIFCEVPYANLIEFRMSQVNRITQQLAKMFSESSDNLIRHFNIENIEYGFIPNLDDMTFGEYVDLDAYLKDWQDMHKAMSVLYRPIKQKHKDRYLIEKYTGRDQDIFKKMPLDACFSAIVFFYNLGNELSRAMLGYLKPQEREIFQQSALSDKDGVGISRFMHSLKEILQDTKISLN